MYNIITYIMNDENKLLIYYEFKLKRKPTNDISSFLHNIYIELKDIIDIPFELY